MFPQGATEGQGMCKKYTLKQKRRKRKTNQVVQHFEVPRFTEEHVDMWVASLMREFNVTCLWLVGSEWGFAKHKMAVLTAQAYKNEKLQV